MKWIGTAAALLCAAATLHTLPVTAKNAETSDSEPTVLVRSSDQIVTDADGNASIPDGKGKAKGFITLQPNFRMGDATGDGTVDAQDAAELLIAAAEAGASGNPAETILQTANPTHFANESAALYFADINENGSIGSDDAADILVYSAGMGAGLELPPLGTHTYWADADGILQKGFFTDPESGMTYYAGENYALCQGWLDLDDARYFLDETGALQPEGWLQLESGRYYLNADGTVARETWLETPDGKFYADAQGAVCQGITQIGEDFYLFDENGLVTGWFETAAGKGYCNENGTPLTGQQTIDEAVYFFDPETYLAVTGEHEEDGVIRHYDENGVLRTGWIEKDDVRYYFNVDGTPASGLTEIGEDSYFFDENGAMVTGWVPIDNTRRYFGEDGIMYKLWHDIDGSRYCFGGGDGVMLTGWAEIGGNRYYFGTDGIMVTNQTVENWYLTEDGTAISNTLHINKERAQTAFAKNGTTVDGIWKYVRGTIRYKKIESTKTLAQIESNGWLYYVDYSFTHSYGVCYYLAAKMDFLLQEAGYECRIVHSTHGSGDHYWNQVNIDGVWVNYDCTNGLYAKNWDQMIAYGNYRFLGYVTPEYK